MVEKNSSSHRDEINFFYMIYMEENYFLRFVALYYQKSMEFLSSLVFHTVIIQVIPHCYKQGLVQ